MEGREGRSGGKGVRVPTRSSATASAVPDHAGSASRHQRGGGRGRAGVHESLAHRTIREIEGGDGPFQEQRNVRERRGGEGAGDDELLSLTMQPA